MKRTLLLVVVVVSLLASPAAARQWTSRAGGFSVEAELVDVKDGNVILKKTDGSQLTVPLNKLSLGDVRYIDDVLKSAEAGITGAKTESPAPAAPEAARRVARRGETRRRDRRDAQEAALRLEEGPDLRLPREDHRRARKRHRESHGRRHLQGEIDPTRRDPVGHDQQHEIRGDGDSAGPRSAARQARGLPVQCRRDQGSHHPDRSSRAALGEQGRRAAAVPVGRSVGTRRRTAARGRTGLLGRSPAIRALRSLGWSIRFGDSRSLAFARAFPPPRRPSTPSWRRRAI